MPLGMYTVTGLTHWHRQPTAVAHRAKNQCRFLGQPLLPLWTLLLPTVPAFLGQPRCHFGSAGALLQSGACTVLPACAFTQSSA